MCLAQLLRKQTNHIPLDEGPLAQELGLRSVAALPYKVFSVFTQPDIRGITYIVHRVGSDIERQAPKLRCGTMGDTCKRPDVKLQITGHRCSQQAYLITISSKLLAQEVTMLAPSSEAASRAAFLQAIRQWSGRSFVRNSDGRGIDKYGLLHAPVLAFIEFLLLHVFLSPE